MIERILNLYRQRFHFIRFYDNLLYNIASCPEYHIKSETFLMGYLTDKVITEFAGKITTVSGDTRVDLPVWFGNSNSTNKFIVMGLEPRDTDKTGGLNIERCEKYVFGTPFALERPKGPYYSAFFEATKGKDSFIYFTDIVKTYNVTGIKMNDDKNAREDFKQESQQGKEFLLEELKIIPPKKVIALGNVAQNFLPNNWKVVNMKS